jgi:hypothetical protein
MSFLRNLFGTKSADGPDPLAARFEEEWHRPVRCFGVVAGYRSFQFNLRHPDTGELMKPHEGVEAIFEEWKTIQSPWDRWSLFFRCILATRGVDQFHIWAVANAFTFGRHPDSALEMLQQNDLTEPGSEFHARHCGAFARAWIALHRPPEALEIPAGE